MGDNFKFVCFCCVWCLNTSIVSTLIIHLIPPSQPEVSTHRIVHARFIFKHTGGLNEPFLNELPWKTQSWYKKWHFLGPSLSFQPHFNPSGLLCSIRTSKSLQESGSLLTQDLSPLSLHPLVLSLKSVPHGQLPTLSRMSYRLLLH